MQSIIVFDTFLRLSEDILFFQDVPTVRRRELCASLSDNVEQIIKYAMDTIFFAADSNVLTVCHFDD